ncbi:MAG: glycosyltransferase [Scandinavium sp.]|uniref:glycosyltransferase n=1 Tax=Scandinavium sp. TaxID=2830653 RepID=UPI003F368E08
MNTNTVTFSARKAENEWHSAIAQALKTGADILVEDLDEDRFHVVAHELKQHQYRCIGESRFTPLRDEQLHIVVTATNDNTHFLQPVIAMMREQGHLVSELPNAGMTQASLTDKLKHCDLAWFEWGDSAIIAASHLPKYCRIVCRIHRYELYGSAFLQANWENVDEVIVVSEAMKKRFVSQLADKLPPRLKITVLPNLTGHLPKPVQGEKNPFHLACVARFAPQKNLMQLLPIMQALVRTDSRYTVYIAGRIEDQCLYESFCELVKTYGLSRNVVIEGALPAAEMANWYQRKSFILSVSYNESQGMGIFEAMLAGLKPIVFHAAGGLSEYLPARYLLSSIDDAVASIVAGNEHPERYAQEAQAALQQDALYPKYARLWQRAPHDAALFSIVIPCYNRESLILPAVCSALNQRDENFEVVVVDDGSQDRSMEMLENLHDSRLRIIKKPHTNAPDTRNAGIAAAKGCFIVWLDSDDLLHANALSHYRELLAQWPQVDVISCGMETHGDNKEFRALNNHSPANWLHLIARGNIVANPGCCIRKTLYAKVGDYDVRYLRAHDYEFWSRALGTAKAGFTAQCNITYRLHDGNLTGMGKPVDHSYEYRIFNAILQRYRPEALFPGVPRKQVEAFIAAQRQSLRDDCGLDNLLIVIDATQGAVESLLDAINLFGLQQDKAFQLVVVSSEALPLASLSVLIAPEVCPVQVKEYAQTVFPETFSRIYQWQPQPSNDNPQLVADLKNAILEDSALPAVFRAL